MTGRLRSTLQGPGQHKRGRPRGEGRGGTGTLLFDIEAVEAEPGGAAQGGVARGDASESVASEGVASEGVETAGSLMGEAAKTARASATAARAVTARLTGLRARAGAGMAAVAGLSRRWRRDPAGTTGSTAAITGGTLTPPREGPTRPPGFHPSMMRPADAPPSTDDRWASDEWAAIEWITDDDEPVDDEWPIDDEWPANEEEWPVDDDWPVDGGWPVGQEAATDEPAGDSPAVGDAVDEAVGEVAQPATGWLPVDPRIAERRLSVIREASRQRRQLAVAALSVVTAAVVAVLAVHSALFGVRHVRIRGAVHTDLALIAREAGVDSSTPMVDVNSSAIAARLLRLPWVGTVRVTTEWPATVRIQITERVPVAVVAAGPAAGGGRFALVDQTGRVLDVTDTPGTGLLALTGVAPAGPPGTQLDSEADAALAVAASLPPDLIARLATVGPATKVRNDPNTDLTLQGGGVVLWGSPVDASEKTVALRTVLMRVDLRRIATIDVRVPQAPTVRRP